VASRKKRPTRRAAAPETQRGAPEAPKSRRRMTADERRHSILEAARKAFAAAGDATGTTIKDIAKAAGISEGVIYLHFASKDELFFEAIVEPLHAAIDRAVRNTAHLTPAKVPALKRAGTRVLLLSLVRSFQEILPELGLVLFGDPLKARRFYRSTFAKMERELAEAWEDYSLREVGREWNRAKSAALAHIGIALMVALDMRLAKEPIDAEQAVSDLTELIVSGFFREIDETASRKAGPKAAG